MVFQTKGCCSPERHTFCKHDLQGQGVQNLGKGWTARECLVARERHHERISRRSHLNAGNSHNESIFVLCPGHKTAAASLTAPVSAHCLPLSPSQLQLCELSHCIRRATSNVMPFFFFFGSFLLTSVLSSKAARSLSALQQIIILWNQALRHLVFTGIVGA